MKDNFVDSKTVKYFDKLIKLAYLCGLPDYSSNAAVKSLASMTITRIHGFMSKMTNVLMILLILFEWVALLVQKDLSAKQSADLVIFCFSHPIMNGFYMNFYYQRDQIRDLIYSLTVKVKTEFNDEEVERKMIRKSKLFSAAFVGMVCSALVFYGFDGIMLIIKNGSTFTTIITGWPDVNDKSRLASFGRIAIYFCWWVLMVRASAAYVYVISLTVCLSHQYQNLGRYFKGLRDIFEQTNLSQMEKEQKYVDGIKVGVQLHSETLSCTAKTEKLCSFAYGGQILVNIFVLVLLMSQMINSKRTFSNTLPIVTTSVNLLLATGFFMWSAGDVTVEAANLQAAIFDSGWENCQEKSLRIRALLVVAIAQAQKPVIMKTLGIIDLSYNSYLQIVKSTYSLFSFLY